MKTAFSAQRRGQTWPFIALGVVLVLIGIALFSGLYLFPRFAAPYGYYFPFFPFGFLWIIIGFFLFFGLLRFIFWPWGWGGHRRRYGYGYDDSYRILRERYARGEITKDQLDQMTRDLDQHR